MINNFDTQIQHLEEVIAKYNLALDFFKKLGATGEITVKEAMEVGLFWLEINERGKFRNIELKKLNPNAVIKGIEELHGTTIRATKLEGND